MSTKKGEFRERRPPDFAHAAIASYVPALTRGVKKPHRFRPGTPLSPSAPRPCAHAAPRRHRRAPRDQAVCMELFSEIQEDKENFSKFYANRITDSPCVLSRVAPCTRADHHGHTSPLLDVSRPPSTRSDAFRHILRPLRRPAHPNNPSRHVSQHDRPAIHPHPHTVRPSESYSPRWSDVARPALCTGLANGCWMPRHPTRARRPQS